MSTTSMAIFSNPLFATYSVNARNTSLSNAAYGPVDITYKRVSYRRYRFSKVVYRQWC